MKWLGRWLCSMDCHRWTKFLTSRMCKRCPAVEYLKYDYYTGIQYWERR